MRHFRDLDDVIAALAAEAENLGQEVQRRPDGTFLIFKIDCECGAHAVTEVNLANTAAAIWSAFDRGSEPTSRGVYGS
ncbi:hypothetical protein [Shinella sp. G-2]|uniref:hypothetical protein n=1 Tax=Shinella sp. G-2 TaxID=3133141 RepID=UPI003D023C4E